MTAKKSLKLFGLNYYFDELTSAYSNNNFPNKILFSGRKGIGKKTLVTHLINYIFSEKEEFKYDFVNKKINPLNRSYKMSENNIHPNLYKIALKNGKKNIDISQIREMINFINKSSFNNNKKIILIEDIEFLNLFSANALLKSLEEPNTDVIFILLLNNEKSCLNTIKSRCLEYKLVLDNKFLPEIIDNYFSNKIYQYISKDLINYYIPPSLLIRFIIFCDNNNLNYKSISIDGLIKYYLKNNIYKKNESINEDIKFYIELFFYTKINRFKTNELNHLYLYFNKRFDLINKFNLDLESFFIEFNTKFFK